MTAQQVATALRVRPMSSGYLCHRPVPGHGKGRSYVNPGLSVSDGNTALRVTCFAGCRRECGVS